MGIFESLPRMVRVELTSADIPGALQTMNAMKIPISNLSTDGDLTVQFTVGYRYFQKIKRLTERKGERIIILSREGIFWLPQSVKGRPVIVICFCLLLALTVLLPTRVLVVNVEGNERIPDNMILDAAKDAGIGFGVSRRSVRSEKIKNRLLDILPQLQWAGVNTYGCTAVISVRERAIEKKDQQDYTVSNTIASCDGLITSCTVLSGSALCGEGQVVKKGQVLITGYSDYGNLITAQRGSGEIFANTRHEATAVSPLETGLRGDSTAKQTFYSLCFGKKRINLYKGSGISDGRCVKMIKKYHLTLPGGFVFPLSLIKEEHISYQIMPHKIRAADSEESLSGFLKQYIRSSGIARCINDAAEDLEINQNLIVLNGVYYCNEMIGREQGVQIGDLHGKAD